MLFPSDTPEREGELPKGSHGMRRPETILNTSVFHAEPPLPDWILPLAVNCGQQVTTHLLADNLLTS